MIYVIYIISTEGVTRVEFGYLREAMENLLAYKKAGWCADIYQYKRQSID